MTDYGRPLGFGVFPVPEASSYDDVVAIAREADQAGLDFVGIQDHPYQKRYLDTLSLIADLAARTERVRFFPDVTSLPLRPPGVLAKTAASIDIMSNGRFELGLGAGEFWDTIAAIGGPRRAPGEALQALEEAIDVIRLMWSDERSVRYDGVHHSLAGVRPGPPPAHPIEIWLGVGGPRALALLDRKADGLTDRPTRILALGVGEAELRRYGSPAEHDRAHGIDTTGIKRSLRSFLEEAPELAGT